MRGRWSDTGLWLELIDDRQAEACREIEKILVVRDDLCALVGSERACPLRGLRVNGTVELREVRSIDRRRFRIYAREMIGDVLRNDLAVERIDEKVRVAERVNVAFR